MAASHGTKAVFWLDNLSNVLQNLSTYLRSVKIDQEAKVVFRTIPGLQEVNQIGQTNGVIALEGVIDPVPINQLQALWGSNAARDALYNWQYGPQGGTTGLLRLSGTSRMTMFHLESTEQDASTWQANLEITDNVVVTDTWP